MEEVIAKRQFVLDASTERVWSLMGRVVLGNLPGLEKMQLINENSFRAVLQVKIAFVNIAMPLKGLILSDVDHPESLGVLLKARGMGGLVQLNQKVTFTIKPLEQARSEVVCESLAQDVGLFFRMFLMGKVKSMAASTLEGMEARLKQIA